MIRTLPTPRDTLLALTVFFSTSPLACSSGPEPPVKGPSVPPAAALPYPSTPWTFDIDCEQAMGLGLGDINGDGFVDVVVSNGNDIKEQPVYVYYNDKTGHFPKTPSWRSDDLGFHTGLSLGDVDADGFLDVAVSLGPPAGAPPEKGGVVLYYNRGGELEKVPSYRTDKPFTSIGCALGDADGDGDLDLATSVARTPNGGINRAYVFNNVSGRPGGAPTWQSRDPVTSTAVLFADVNHDGLLDLTVGGSSLETYFGELTGANEVVLANTPAFHTAPSASFVAGLDAGRIGASTALIASFSDYASSTALARSQGSSCPSVLPVDGGCTLTSSSKTRFLGYRPTPAAKDPPGAPSPFWQSKATGWGGGESLADLDGDGRLDLIAGRWGPSTRGAGAPLMIYLGTDDSLQTEPVWTSDTCTLVEAVAAADLDNARLSTAEETFTFTAPSAVVTLAHRPVARIEQVLKNGLPVDSKQYSSTPAGDWISFARRLLPADKLVVRYSYAPTPDLVAVNFESANMIFYRQLPAPPGPAPRAAAHPF